MTEEIILYDLPSKAPSRSWSGNVWKTRLALNYKGIPYKTEWVRYIHLEETLKSKGIEPNPPGSWSAYSVPTMRLPDGSYLMDSGKIAHKLEELYPEPSLHLDSELESEAEAATRPLFMAFFPYLGPYCIKNTVAAEDEDWWIRDRASRLGITPEQLMAEKDLSPAFVAAKPGFDKATALLTRHKKDNGPFILGSTPCYADFLLMATLQLFGRIMPEHFDQLWTASGTELKGLWEACADWTKNDH